MKTDVVIDSQASCLSSLFKPATIVDKNFRRIDDEFKLRGKARAWRER